MQKLGLHQTLQQKLSPQQIQFIKLLEVPTAELEARIEEELEMNPALEEGVRENEVSLESLKNSNDSDENDDNYGSDDMSLADYIGSDDRGYKMHADGEDDNEDKDIPFAEEVSLQEALLTQLSFLKLNETQYKIGEQIIGSIDEDGYLRRNIESIVNDLAFTQNIITDEDEVLSVLFKIQQFDPAGIGARNLQECLLIQLERKTDHLKEVNNAITIIEDYFEEFTKKHYDKIIQKMGIQEEDLKKALKIITKCNPKPGSGNETQAKSQFLIPDFIVVNNNGKLELSLNAKNAPELQISSSYIEMFDAYDKASKVDKKMKEAVTFVKQKLDAAKWFIDAIKQRQNTLLCTMNTILEFQKEFFLTQDESTLKPMILKDIAERINMDISTVSRVVNSKCVQTEFGIFPLKYFFSEGITTESGEDVSSKEVKNMLYQLIKEEDKSHPLGDEELEKLLKNKGYNIARRTVAKYREQLNIPVARLRKEL